MNFVVLLIASCISATATFFLPENFRTAKNVAAIDMKRTYTIMSEVDGVSETNNIFFTDEGNTNREHEISSLTTSKIDHQYNVSGIYYTTFSFSNNSNKNANNVRVKRAKISDTFEIDQTKSFLNENDSPAANDKKGLLVRKVNKVELMIKNSPNIRNVMKNALHGDIKEIFRDLEIITIANSYETGLSTKEIDRTILPFSENSNTQYGNFLSVIQNEKSHNSMSPLEGHAKLAYQKYLYGKDLFPSNDNEYENKMADTSESTAFDSEESRIEEKTNTEENIFPTSSITENLDATYDTFRDRENVKNKFPTFLRTELVKAIYPAFNSTYQVSSDEASSKTDIGNENKFKESSEHGKNNQKFSAINSFKGSEGFGNLLLPSRTLKPEDISNEQDMQHSSIVSSQSTVNKLKDSTEVKLHSMRPQSLSVSSQAAPSNEFASSLEYDSNYTKVMPNADENPSTDEIMIRMRFAYAHTPKPPAIPKDFPTADFLKYAEQKRWIDSRFRETGKKGGNRQVPIRRKRRQIDSNRTAKLAAEHSGIDPNIPLRSVSFNGCCYNGGTCYYSNRPKVPDDDNGDTRWCLCPAAFSGRYCERDVNECTMANVCNAHEICVNKYGGFKCVCAPDFVQEGDDCIPRVTCEELPCLNGAACVDSDDGDFKCVCPLGFLGRYCQIRVADCEHSSCTQEETCITMETGYRCVKTDKVEV